LEERADLDVNVARWKDAWWKRLEGAACKVGPGKEDEGVSAARKRGPPLLPPLRTETKNLLLRQPEELRPIAPFLILIAKTIILGFNLWAQLYALAAMCRGPFLCSSLRFLPVIAPPAAFRVGGPGARYYQGQRGMRLEACPISAGAACADPGYKIQWPYIQESKGDPTTRIPAGLLAACRLVEGTKDGLFREEDGGWVWDPFELQVRGEYLDCSATCGGSVGPAEGGCLVPFAEGGVSMHFDPTWYSTNAALARGCLARYFRVDGQPDPAVFDLVAAARAAGAPPISQEAQVHRCMTAACAPTETVIEALMAGVAGCALFSESMSACRCGSAGDTWEAWALSLFHPPPGPTAYCEAGAFRGQACTADSDCADSTNGDSVRCRRPYPDQVPLNTSSKYGCFFSSPVAEAETEPVLNACTISGGSDTYKQMSNQMWQLLGQPSSFVVLMLSFLLKEGCYFTATLVISVVLCTLVCLLLACMPLIALLFLCKKGKLLKPRHVKAMVLWMLAPSGDAALMAKMVTYAHEHCDIFYHDSSLDVAQPFQI